MRWKVNTIEGKRYNNREKLVVKTVHGEHTKTKRRCMQQDYSTQDYIVHTTENYDFFVPDKTNRPIDWNKVRKLAESIQRKNLLAYYPLIVDVAGKIRDGHHRYYAAKQLGVPLFYIVAHNMMIEDVAEAASLQNGWKLKDTMHHFCSRGFEEYIALKEFHRLYPWLSLQSAVNLSYTGDRKDLHEEFRRGLYSANALDFAVIVANAALDFSPYISYYKETPFVSSIRNLIQNKNYVHERMLRKLKFRSSELRKCADTSSYIAMIEPIYNYKESENDKVHLKKVMPGAKDFLAVENVVKANSGR